jgi:thiosulfate reductase cytochrome b subunit
LPCSPPLGKEFGQLLCLHKTTGKKLKGKNMNKIIKLLVLVLLVPCIVLTGCAVKMPWDNSETELESYLE